MFSYYHSSTTPSCFKRYIPRLPFDTNRIKGGMLGKRFFGLDIQCLSDILEVKNIMTSIAEETFIKPVHMSMEEYDEQVFRAQMKS